MITGNITITGGIISGEVWAVCLRGSNGSVRIEGGYISGPIGGESTAGSAMKKTVITGGYFTDYVADYVAKGYHCATWEQSVGSVTYNYKVAEHIPGKVTVENRVEPTCVENGSYDEVTRCTECNEVVSSKTTVIPASGHTFEYVNNDNGTHTATCTVCNTVEISEHSYGDWVVTIPATCTTNGSHYRTCICENVDTEVISALGHDFPAEGEGTVTTEPTCTEAGEMTYACKNGCGWKMTSPIAALGHDYVAVPETPATCTETGLTAGVVCSRCGDVESGREEIPMLPTVAMIGEERFPSVGAAVEATEDGSTIVLMADTAEQVTISGKTLTLDLNGHTLSSFYNSTATYPSWLVPLSVTNKADVTIIGNGEISNNENGKAVTVSNAKLIVNGGKISADNNVYKDAIGIYVTGDSSTTVTINGGEVYGKAYAIDNTASGTVNVNGGTIHGGNNYSTIRADRLATVNVNGGTVQADGNNNALTTKPTTGNVGGGKINMTGGKVKGGVFVYGKNSVVTISGGEISGEFGVSMNGGTVQISDGTISGKSRSVSAASTACVVTVTGGWFKGDMGYISSGFKGQPPKGTLVASDKITVSGGFFTNDVSLYLVENHHTECGSELSRVHQTIECKPHTPGESVEENRVEPTCTTAGSYDEVVCCEVCGEELSRETKTIEATGHVIVEHKTNGDGTHTGVCGCGEVKTDPEVHQYNEDGVCTVCGAQSMSVTAADGQVIIVESGDTLGENIPAAPYRSGYSFAGWFTAEEGGEQIDADTPILCCS